MIRVVAFFVVVGLLALGFAWFANHPGDVIVTWQGLRIKTTPTVLAVALLAALAVLAAVWWLLIVIVRSPATLARRRRNRRAERAYEAMSHGLVAIGSGDIDAARKHAAEVNRLAPHEPLALLLNAQSAQLAGDRAGAERAFRTMAGRDDTKTLGLHGLFIEARRRDDHAGARAYAEEAARTSPALGWASRAVLEARVKDGDWAGALHLLERNLRALEKSIYRRLRAVLLTAQAQMLEDTDRDRAKAQALEAQKLAPTLVPAAALAGRLLAADGQHRKARRVIDRAWRANPHPELAQAYAEIRSGDSARDRLKRIETLAKRVPDHIESALATVRAAIDAREFAKARALLASYLAAPTKRIALLMAELERAEHNDEGRAREWLSRALHAAPDPAWTADDYVSNRWLPASPVTGRLDAFEWRVPVTGMLGAEPAIPADTALIAAKTEPAPIEPHDDDPPLSPPADVAPPAAVRPQPSPSQSAPVIPLVHAPDDPGPVDEVDAEEAEPEQEAKPSGWRKIFE
jgi:HemY protein